ncbi:hypothetical protein ACHAW6_000788, partial [Cyclotella cf. meneghiniana]
MARSYRNGTSMLKWVDSWVFHGSTQILLHWCEKRTGYMSSQYHVVFDVKFKTVFHDGKTSKELDKICDEL